MGRHLDPHRTVRELLRRGGVTAVSVRTGLTVTGRPAQFGRGVPTEVGERIIGRFAACLSEQLTQPAGAADTTGTADAADTSGAAVATGAAQAVRRAETPPDEPPGLLRTAGPPVAKRAAAVLAGAVVPGLPVARIRRRRRP
ncbi:hypothetical protein [Streptomyces incanus]|uniref:Uncharacterized protein n=1 Tax=Streptomyces incanus TaxID=887453 RepID=A0ABW0XQD6_9ACTN